MRKILMDAAAVGNAAGRALNWRPSDRSIGAITPAQPGPACCGRGANFETPPPMVTCEGFRPLPATGAAAILGNLTMRYQQRLREA